MQDHTQLLVWRKAKLLTVAVHEAAQPRRLASAPGLRSQLLKAVMSIAATIAEGASRSGRHDFARFVTMAIGSTSETIHHLTVCGDLGLLEPSSVTVLVDQAVEVRRMLFGLRRALLRAEA